VVEKQSKCIVHGKVDIRLLADVVSCFKILSTSRFRIMPSSLTMVCERLECVTRNLEKTILPTLLEVLTTRKTETKCSNYDSHGLSTPMPIIAKTHSFAKSFPI